MQPADKTPPERRTDPTAELLLPTDKCTDPVCAMSVDPSHAADSVVHDGRTYYFCSKSCRQKFQADPKQYLRPRSTEQGVMSQKVQDPVCGMTIDRDQLLRRRRVMEKRTTFAALAVTRIPGGPGQVRGRHAAILAPPPSTGGTILPARCTRNSVRTIQGRAPSAA